MQAGQKSYKYLLSALVLLSGMALPVHADLVPMVSAAPAAMVVLRPMVAASDTISLTTLDSNTEQVASTLHRMVEEHRETVATLTPMAPQAKQTQLALRRMSPEVEVARTTLQPMVAHATMLAQTLTPMDPKTPAGRPVLVAMEPAVAKVLAHLYPMKTLQSGTQTLLGQLPTVQQTAQSVASASSAGSTGSAGADAGSSLLSQIVAAQQTLGTSEALPSLAAQPLPQVAAQPLPAGEEEVLLAFKLDKILLPDILSARRVGGQGPVYLPLALLMQQFGFPIKVSGNYGTAEGWFMDPTRTFKLNTLDNYVEIAGKRQSLPPGSYIREGDEIFISADQLQQWFPVQYNVEWDSLTLNATTTEVLPEVARLERQKLWQQISSHGADMPDGPEHVLERPFADWPSLRIDETSNFAHATEPNTKANTLTNTMDIQAQGSMLGMDGYLALAFQQGSTGDQGLTGGTLRLSRDDPSATLLGPLAATHFEMGDVSLPHPSLMATQGQGRGFEVTNEPVGFAGSLNQFELKGEGPLGWDVEVYQDESLLAFSTVGPDGRYHFTQLNLRPGVNDFRIVLYGPKGEKEERRQSYYLGEGMVKPGQWVYEAGITQSSQPLIGAQNNSLLPSANQGTMVLNSFYGINRNISVNLGAANGPMGGYLNQASGATVGLRTAFGRTFGQFNVAGFSDGSSAYTARQSIRLGKSTDITTFYTRNASTTLPLDQARSSSGLQLTDVLHFKTPVTYGLTYERDSYPGRTEQSIASSQNWHIGQVAFSNSIGRHYTPAGPQWNSGNFSFTAPVAGLPWRGEVIYNPSAGSWLNSAALSTQMHLDDTGILTVEGLYQPISNLSSLQASLQRDIGPVTVGVKSTIQSNNDYQLGMNIGMQFMPEPSEGPSGIPKYKAVAAHGEGFGYGSADVLVFIDDNMNGVIDPGEEVLTGVEIRNIRTGRTTNTNAQGIARVNDLLPETDTIVQISENSLPDLYLKPASQWHKLLAHHGYGGVVPLPIWRYGEVDGVVQVPANVDVRRVQLWLTNAKGEKLETTQPDIDGSFYFQSVLLGAYTLHAQRAGGAVVDTAVTLTRKQPVPDNLNIHMQ